MEVPRNTKVKRKSQKKSVPNTEQENTEMARDCRDVSPKFLDKRPSPAETTISMINFLIMRGKRGP
jgi:hypothetical protein